MAKNEPRAIDPKTGKRLSLPLPRCQQAEVKRNVWHIVPEPGTPFEALLDPSYWAHVARNFRPWDRVEVNYDGDDGAWFAELLVRSTGDLWTVMVPVHKVDLKGVSRETGARLSAFDVKYSDPHNRYVVIRKADGSRIKEGCQTREEAERWAAEHVKALAA